MHLEYGVRGEGGTWRIILNVDFNHFHIVSRTVQYSHKSPGYGTS